MLVGIVAGLALLIGALFAGGSASAQTSNPIVVENQLPGSSAWRLDQPADDTNQQIKGYASATSVDQGSDITFFVTVNPAQSYDIDVYRMGWYDGMGARLMQEIGPITGTPQSPVTVDPTTGLVTAPWTSSHTLTVPTTWTSGVYLAKLINAGGFDNYIIFVVRDDDRTADLLYQQSATTDQAYNNFPDDGVAGKSLYDNNSHGAATVAGSPRAVKVSFDRPYSGDGAGLFFHWEYDLVAWLEQNGYDVTYSTNIDTHTNAGRLLTVDGFLSTGHDEYWTAEMFDAAEAARDNGTDLAFFGANSVYWQIRLEPSAGGVADRTIVSYKDALLDPEIDPALETDLFRRVGRPQQELIGVDFLGAASNTATTTDYIVQNAGHWAYANSGFQDGSVVPAIVGYEVDGYDAGFPLPAATNYALLSASPFTTVSGGQVMANSVIYQAPSGAWVFTAGTMSWSWALSRTGYVNAGIQQTTANVIDRFLSGDPLSNTPPTLIDPGAQSDVQGQVVGLTLGATDPDGDLLYFSASGLPAGLVIDSSTGTISGLPTTLGTATTTVTVNDGNGGSDSLNLSWTISAGTGCGSLAQEAEDGLLGGSFVVGLDPAASGGQYVHVPNGSGNSSFGSDSRAEFCVTTDVPATYRLLGSVRSVNGGEDSFYVTIDGLPAVGFLWDTVRSSAYLDDYLNDRGGADPVEVDLAAGDHTIIFYLREDGTRLDKFQLELVEVLVNNDPIVISPANQLTLAGDAATVTISASDPDGDPLTFSATDLPPGFSIDATSGVISGAGTTVGTYAPTVTASDGRGGVGTASFTWVVDPASTVNRPPTLTDPGEQESSEGEVVSLTLSAADLDGDALTFGATGLPPTLAIDPSTGEVSGSATTAGVFTVVATVDDGNGGTASVAFDWTVSVVTGCGALAQEAEDGVLGGSFVVGLDPAASGGQYVHAPNGSGNSSFGSDSRAEFCVTTDVPATYRLLGSVRSVNGGEDSFYVTIDGLPAVGFLWDTVRSSAYLDDYLNDRGGADPVEVDLAAGDHTIIFYLREDGTRLDKFQLEPVVTLPNNDPTVTSPGNQLTLEGGAATVAVSATDIDGDPLTFSATGLPPGLGIDPTSGVISGTATTVGTYDPIVTASDGRGGVGTTTFTWVIDPASTTNQPPTITDPGDQLTTEGTAVSLTLSAADPDGDVLTFAATGLPPTLAIDTSTGEVSGSVTAVGSYPVTVTVDDGNGGIASTAFNWVVTAATPCGPLAQEAESGTLGGSFAVAADPAASGGQYVHAPNGSGNAGFGSASRVTFCMTVDTAATFRILGTVYATSGSDDSFFVTVDDLPTTGYLWDLPRAGQYTSDPVSARGGADPVLLTLQPGDHTVTVYLREDGSRLDRIELEAVSGPGNQPPSLTQPTAQSNTVGDVAAVTLEATDLDGDPLSFAATNLPTGLVLDTATGVIAGTLAAPGAFTVTVTVDDGNGGVDSATFTWTVNGQTGSDAIYVSLRSGGNAGGIPYSDEDVLAFDIASSTWAVHFDGSDVGLSGSGARDIDALHLLDDGSILFSIVGSSTLPDVGEVDDSDIIRFVPTSLGVDTAGTFEVYLDASDVGLTTNGEDINAISVLPGGDILISVVGSFNVGVTGDDEDVLRFTPTTLGSTSSGTWALYADGSDLGLIDADEDVWGISTTGDGADLDLTTRATFDASGLTGDGADIITCQPGVFGVPTTCSLALRWDGSLHGLSGDSIDGLFLTAPTSGL